MDDKEFLIWLYDKFELDLHIEPGIDFMKRLKAIIACTPRGKVSSETLITSFISKER